MQIGESAVRARRLSVANAACHRLQVPAALTDASGEALEVLLCSMPEYSAIDPHADWPGTRPTPPPAAARLFADPSPETVSSSDAFLFQARPTTAACGSRARCGACARRPTSAQSESAARALTTRRGAWGAAAGVASRLGRVASRLRAPRLRHVPRAQVADGAARVSLRRGGGVRVRDGA